MNSLIGDHHMRVHRHRRSRECCGIAGAIALALTMLAATAAAQADSSWMDHERALQAAREANDTINYRAQLNAEYKAIGSTQRIAGRYAALAIGTHDSVGASRWMHVLAAMGDELDTGLVSRYGALAGARAMESLRAAHARATRDEGAPLLAVRLPDPDVIAEDIAYDAAGARFLVSSVHHGGIYTITGGLTTTS
jgi:hypothetical protein